MNKNQEKRIVNYRNKHPRCRYCKYLKTIKTKIKDVDSYGFWYGQYITTEYYKCELKDKYIKLNNSFKGCFCDYFELEDI